MGISAVGYLASALVLAAFCAKDMLTLRILAIASNVAFIAYAYLADLRPILLLHCSMLPVNICRLRSRGREQAGG